MIDTLRQLGLTEDHIVSLLGITHLRYRHSYAPVQSVTRSVLEEIKHRTDLSIKDVQELYRLTYNEAHRALYSSIPQTLQRHVVPWQHTLQDDVMEYVQHNNPTRQDIAKRYGLSKEATAMLLQTLGFTQTQKSQITALLKTAPQVSYTKLAQVYGMSKPYIAQLAKEAGIIRSVQRDKDPQQVLADAQELGIESAAKKHGVSRAYVYYHRSKGHV